MERQQRLSRETSEPELTIEVAHFNIEQEDTMNRAVLRAALLIAALTKKR